MIRKAVTLLLVVALVASAVPAAALTSEPDIRTVVPQPTVTPGEQNTVEFQFVNDADGAEDETITATNVEVAVGDRSPLDVRTDRLYVEQLVDGTPVTQSLQVGVPADIDAGTYRIPLDVTYEFESTSGDQRQITRSKSVPVRVREGPRFVVTDTDSTATANGRGTLTVDVENVGEQAASDATFSLASTNSDVSLGGGSEATRFVSEWGQGETQTFEFDARLGESTRPGNYSLDGGVSYEDPDGNSGTSPTLTVGLRALPEVTFDVSDVESSLRVGGEGTVSGNVTNTGPVTANNAVVNFQSNSASAQPIETSYAVGDLEPNETAEFSFTLDVQPQADPGPRQYAVAVDYRNDDGDAVQSGTIDLPARVGASDAGFEIRDVESTLRVGEEGRLNGTVVNTDDEPVSNAVLNFEPSAETVTPVETEFAVGDLEPGESRAFSFEVDVSSSSSAGPRQFGFQVDYRDGDNRQRTSDTLEVRTDVDRQSEEFDVEPVNASLSAGENGEFRVDVTNTRDEVLTDISAKIYTESPLSTDNSEAFIAELEPGETRAVVFEVGASGDALAKTYPVRMDFQYDDGDGDTTMTDTYQVPLEVTESEGGGLPLGLVGVVAVVVIGVAGLVYYRRQG